MKRPKKRKCSCAEEAPYCLCGYDTYNKGHSDMEAYYKSKVEKLEEVIKTGKCKHIAEGVISGGCSLCHLAWCERRIKVLEEKR